LKQQIEFAVLGCGNMSSALIKGIAPHFENIHFHTYTPTKTKAIKLADSIGGTVLDQLDQIKDKQIVFIGCKPQQFDDLARDLKGHLKDEQLVISIMAGLDTPLIEQKLNHSQIVRIMPNTPSEIGAGIITLFSTPEAQKAWQPLCEELFSPVAHIFSFDDESLIDKTTAITGCGPAYLFTMASIFQEYLTNQGVSVPGANKMVVELLSGSAKLLKQKDENFTDLKNQVTSKGGMTEAALMSLEDANLKEMFFKAFDSAYKRGQELKS
jgi:pyrroline-5-carboxylate reductase